MLPSRRSRHSDVPHDLVRCRFCRGTYRLGLVEVTARYADCSVWKTPCCGQTADDRGDTGWKSIKDYTYVKDEGGHLYEKGGHFYMPSIEGEVPFG